tara:strand:+ start:370 stop:558 length:189 start_codon:yes stop_codon:yes gene_type:complete
MNLENARYLVDYDNPSEVDRTMIKVSVDGQRMCVPADPANRHYEEILKQVKAGTLTIADPTL